MLTQPPPEKPACFFKFWHNHQLQDGLHYQNELFYHLQTVPDQQRFALYRQGKALVKQGSDVLIFQHQDGYSLWSNLRNRPLPQMDPSPARRS